MPFKNLAPIEAPTNPDLQNEIEKTINLKSEIFELFDIGRLNLLGFIYILDLRLF